MADRLTREKYTNLLHLSTQEPPQIQDWNERDGWSSQSVLNCREQ